MKADVERDQSALVVRRRQPGDRRWRQDRFGGVHPSAFAQTPRQKAEFQNNGPERPYASTPWPTSSAGRAVNLFDPGAMRASRALPCPASILLAKPTIQRLFLTKPPPPSMLDEDTRVWLSIGSTAPVFPLEDETGKSPPAEISILTNCNARRGLATGPNTHRPSPRYTHIAAGPGPEVPRFTPTRPDPAAPGPAAFTPRFRLKAERIPVTRPFRGDSYGRGRHASKASEKAVIVGQRPKVASQTGDSWPTSSARFRAVAHMAAGHYGLPFLQSPCPTSTIDMSLASGEPNPGFEPQGAMAEGRSNPPGWGAGQHPGMMWEES